MILLVAVAVFLICIGAATFISCRVQQNAPAVCVREVDAFVDALRARLGSGATVPLHVQDQMLAAMADVALALRDGRYRIARGVARTNRYLAEGTAPLRA